MSVSRLLLNILHLDALSTFICFLEAPSPYWELVCRNLYGEVRTSLRSKYATQAELRSYGLQSGMKSYSVLHVNGLILSLWRVDDGDRGRNASRGEHKKPVTNATKFRVGQRSSSAKISSAVAFYLLPFYAQP